MINTIKDLLESKKFLATLGAILTAVGSHLSGAINGQTLTIAIISALGAFVTGQAISDHGEYHGVQAKMMDKDKQ